MAHLYLSFLGHFHVSADGQALTAFATDKTRGLLAYLAAENARPHTRVALAGLLWPDQPDERARQSLRQTLLYLRQALGPCADRLQVDRDTVQLTLVPGDRLDVAEFVALSDACRRHRHQRACRCLPCLHRREAMAALYDGDFLASFFVDNSDRFEEWAMLKREWLHRHAVESLEALSAYREQRGDLQAARELAHRHVALEPWSEETHRTLMRLMAREGHRSAALAQFESCRRAMADELGVEPTAETMALHDQIRRGTLPPGPHIPTLPPLPPLLGRESEIAELAECIASPQARLITLVGPGGIGKTHLAQQVAQDHAGVFRDGVAFASFGAMDGGASDAEIGVVVAEALGLASTTAGEPWAAVLDHVRHRELLLVLDSIEQLLDCPTQAPDEPTCADRIARLLHLAPEVVLLATSRERLRLTEEQVYDLDGLAYPESPAEPEPERFGAVALFVERARQVQRRFALDASTSSDVLRICTLVGGVPLGIELAAATLGERSLADVATAIGATLDALTTPLRDVTPRHRSLRAAFEHSWALLTDYEQQALAALAVFAGSFDTPAASAVLNANASAALATLLRKSLLRRVDGERSSFHSTIAEYAAEKLAADHERAKVLRARHATYYAALAQRLEPEWRGAGAIAATATLQRERANLRAAWTWAIERQDYARIEPLLGALGLLYRLRGPLPEGVALAQSASAQLAAERASDRHGALQLVRARVQFELSRLLAAGAHYDGAVEAAEQGLAMATGVAGAALEAEGQLVVGQTLVQRAAYDPARDRLAAALELARITDQPLVAADALRELANIANRQSAIEEGRVLYHQALSIYQAHGDIRGETAVLNNLGAMEYDAGNRAASGSLVERALALYRELGDDRGAAKALNNLANNAAAQGEHAEALSRYGEALQMLEMMGNTRGQSVMLNNRGTVLWAVGQYAEAGDHYRRALHIYREVGNEQAAAETLANQALLAYSTGDCTAAVATARQAIALSEQFDDIDNLANAWAYMAKAQTALGALDEAESSLFRALALRGEVLHPESAIELQAELAYVALLRHQPPAALTQIEPVLTALEQDPAITGADEPLRVHWICHRILDASGDPRAKHVLERARATLLSQAERLVDPEMRQSYLESIAIHRALLAH